MRIRGLFRFLTLSVAVLLIIALLLPMRPTERRRYGMVVRSDLRNLISAQEMYFGDSGRYAKDLSVLDYRASTGTVIAELQATSTAWRAVGRHAKWPGKSCVVWDGELVPDERPATEQDRRTYPPADVACDDDYSTVAERWALAYVARMPAVLRRFGAAQEHHFAVHGKYASTLAQLTFTLDSATAITWTFTGDSGWVVVATHPGAPDGRCAMWVGQVPPSSRPSRDYDSHDSRHSPLSIEEAEESVAACSLPGHTFDFVAPIFYDPDPAKIAARLWMTKDLRALVRAQSAHFAVRGAFAATASSLADFATSPGVTLQQLEAGASWWRATVRHKDLKDESCVVWGGKLEPAERPATTKERRAHPPGVPACDGDRRSLESAATMAQLDSAAAALRRVVKAQERYLGRHGRYADRLSALRPPVADSGLRIEFVLRDRGAWAAVASPAERPGRRCLAWAGAVDQRRLPDVPSPAWPEAREVRCIDAFELRDSN